jgi:hypothetical protein
MKLLYGALIAGIVVAGLLLASGCKTVIEPVPPKVQVAK